MNEALVFKDVNTKSYMFCLNVPLASDIRNQLKAEPSIKIRREIRINQELTVQILHASKIHLL